MRRPHILKSHRLNRSMAGNGLLFFLMGIFGILMALPLVMIVNNAVKPLDELFQYPPKLFVRNPTLDNFVDLFVAMNSSWVPFSRYLLNTVIITVGGTVGHVILASLAAYPLSKHRFKGRDAESKFSWKNSGTCDLLSAGDSERRSHCRSH